MKIYFDESVSGSQDLLILGAVFILDSANVFLRNSITKVKEDKDLPPEFEIKYSQITNQIKLKVAKKIIDKFFSTKRCYFRAAVIDMSKINWKRVGNANESETLKKAIVYTRATTALIENGIGEKHVNSSLYYDYLVRSKGDRFQEIVISRFTNKNSEFPKIKHIQAVQSHSTDSNIIQLTDLIIGCILNHHQSSETKTGSIKKELREYLLSKLPAKSLGTTEWAKITPQNKEPESLKFHISYMNPPYNIHFNKGPKNEKNRRSNPYNRQP